MVETKKWYKSWTLRANALMILVAILQYASGTMVLDADTQAIIGAVINILIRFKTTMPIA